MSTFCKSIGSDLAFRRRIQSCIDNINKYILSVGGSPITIGCLFSFCWSSTKIQCGACPPQYRFETRCQTGRCRNKPVTICNICGYASCTPPLIVITNESGQDYWNNQCPNDNTRLSNCDQKVKTLLHEMAHVCSKCLGSASDTHGRYFDQFASCIANAAGCKLI